MEGMMNLSAPNITRHRPVMMSPATELTWLRSRSQLSVNMAVNMAVSTNSMPRMLKPMSVPASPPSVAPSTQ